MGNSASFKENCNTFCIYGLPSNVKLSASTIRHEASQFGKVLSVRLTAERNCYIVYESGVDIASTDAMELSLKHKKYLLRRSTSMKNFVFHQYAECFNIGVLHKSTFTRALDFPSYQVEVACTLAPKNKISIILRNVVRRKLEIEMENIWPNILVELTASYIIVTLSLKRPPKIFSNTRSDTENLNHWQIDNDENWERDIDFTAEERIGECLVYRLVLPHSEHLRTFLLKNEEPYQVQGQCLHCSEHTGLDVSDPDPLILDYKVFPLEVDFKLRSLYTQGIIIDPQITQWEGAREWHEKVAALAAESPFRAMCILNELEKAAKDAIIDPVQFLEKAPTIMDGILQIPLEHLVRVKKLIVTPSRCVFIGPELEVSNRVLREWPDHEFLRVYFRDEDFHRIPRSVLTRSILERISRILRLGTSVGELRYEFLAYSSSQLRDHCCWYFSGTIDASVQDVRHWMGDFSNEKCVAKHAARQGQCFSTTMCTGTVEIEEIKKIPDIKDDTEKYCFSDGLGQISKQFCEYNSKKMHKQGRPFSAFQIRIAGYKGVVLYNRHLHDIPPEEQEEGVTYKYKLALRPSMNKFKSNHYKFEIVTTSNFIPCFLNRQIIQLLTCLGVEDDVFIRLQNDMLTSLDLLTKDSRMSKAFLQQTDTSLNRGLIEMIESGFSLQEPYVYAILHAMKARFLQDLRKKSRIIVKDGSVLIGGMDESLMLDYGECFVQITDPTTGLPRLITGPVVVTRSPCLHPGDIRTLTAVANANMEEDFVDVIIFPAKGPMPHPFEMSNGDLDGDIFFISWDPQLIPKQQFRVPICVTNPKNYAAGVTSDLVKEFYMSYIKNDSLGAICNAHVARADRSELGAADRGCLRLAELAAEAVDFPKTGIPVTLPKDLIPEAYPTYMEFKGAPSYKSKKVIGRLYEDVLAELERVSYGSSEGHMVAPDEELIQDYFKQDPQAIEYLSSQQNVYHAYKAELLEIMVQFDIVNESELFTGRIAQAGGAHAPGKQHHNRVKGKEYHMLETMTNLLRKLQSKYRSIFFLGCVEELRGYGEEGDGIQMVEDPLLQYPPIPIADLSLECRFMITRKASAWYLLAYISKEPPQILSFPWIVHDILCYMKRILR